MARVTTLIYKATGRQRTTDGSVTPTPTNTTVRPPLIADTNALYGPAVEADGLILAPFTDNAQSFYGPIVSAAAVFISPPLLASTEVIFPPTANQTIYLPLTTNEQTFGEPQVLLGQSVVAPLLDDGETFYGPQVNQSVLGPLLSNAETIYEPTVVTGTSILPTPLANDQTFYGPQLNLKVTPGLLTNTQTFPGVSVASGYIVRPTTFASGQAFYGPQVNLKVVSGWVNNTQAFYGPVVSANTLVVAPLLSNSQAFYGPKLNLTVSAPLLTNTATIYSPAVIPDTAQAIGAPYHLNSQTFYGPQLNRNVKPSRLTNTNGFFALTVSNGAVPGFALSTPTVTVISAAGDPPEVTLGINSDHYAGYYLDIERSTSSAKNTSDGSYASRTLRIAHQITPDELAALEITNDDLEPDGYVDPTGTYFQQYRIRREDGALSAWAEITGTVTVSVAKLIEVDGPDKHGLLTVAEGGLSFTGASSGGTCLAKANVSAVSSKSHWEFTVNAISATAGRRCWFGIAETDLVVGPSVVGGLPGSSGATNRGFTVYFDNAAVRIMRNGSDATLGLGPPAVNDKYAIEYDDTTRQVVVKRLRSGVTTTATAHSLSSLVPTTLRAFAGGAATDTGASLNFGGSAFAITPTSGFVAYG